MPIGRVQRFSRENNHGQALDIDHLHFATRFTCGESDRIVNVGGLTQIGLPARNASIGDLSETLLIYHNDRWCRHRPLRVQ